MSNYTGHYSAFFLILTALFPASSFADEYSTFVVFGDSLSDTGNKYAVTGLSNTPPYDLLDIFEVPDGPYTRGGLHHSNGATWIEQLARPLDLGSAVRPALRDPGEASNYAYGGARARNGSPEPDLVATGCLENNNNMHLSDQVNTFLGNTSLPAPDDALYVFFIGGNDIGDAARAIPCILAGSETGIDDIVGGALTSVRDNIIALYYSGAINFLVLNAPDIGLAPAFNPPLNMIPGASQAGTCLSLLYNYGTVGDSPVPPECGFPPDIPGLVDVLTGLQGSLTGINIIGVDIYAEFVRLIMAPQDTEPQESALTCVEPNEPPYACKRPDDYVFWDGIHPTKKTHGIISAVVAEALGVR